MSEHEAWQDSCIIVRSHERCNDVTCEGSFSLSIEDAGKELLPVSHCPTSLEICISGVHSSVLIFFKLMELWPVKSLKHVMSSG